jgi:NNP family nitrate/nitrite transporter-like MFS transporter
MSTSAFAACFAVWTIFSIIGIGIKQQLGLDDTEFGLLIATPILTGALSRLPLGIWADRYGGRPLFVLVMLTAATSAALLSFADTYIAMLAAALGVGIAGGSFAVGIAYVSRWYPKEKQGTALGIFGLGNVGVALTTFIAPFVMVAFGWPAVARAWAVMLVATAAVFWFTTKDDPTRRGATRPRLTYRKQLAPLADARVWRFSLYYFFAFGGLVALALWLPRFYVGAYGLDIQTAGVLGAVFSIPASLFRGYAGVLADRIGARRLMYWCFGACMLITFVLALPGADYAVHGIHGDMKFSYRLGVAPFAMLTFLLGLSMSVGTAAVFRHIPAYYPDHVGPVGGAVGMIGGLGGFVLPIAFGAMNDLTGVWTSCFLLIFVFAAATLACMHAAILRIERFAAVVPEVRLERVTA